MEGQISRDLVREDHETSRKVTFKVKVNLKDGVVQIEKNQNFLPLLIIILKKMVLRVLIKETLSLLVEEENKNKILDDRIETIIKMTLEVGIKIKEIHQIQKKKKNLI